MAANNKCRASDCIDDSNVPSEILNGRIYLNNHLSPAAAELSALCSKLRQDRKTMKYKVINVKKPFVMLILLDNTTIKCDLQGCVEFLNKGTNADSNA
uniref:Uncharacterized protein n=1 Tax=Glossina palpalis gambiensis TaxID=67801 RepID=A0A1B0BZD4_9MUSC